MAFIRKHPFFVLYCVIVVFLFPGVYYKSGYRFFGELFIHLISFICIYFLLQKNKTFFVTNWFNPNNFQLFQNIWIILFLLCIFIYRSSIATLTYGENLHFIRKNSPSHISFEEKKEISHLLSNKESSHSILLPHLSQGSVYKSEV